MKIASLFEEGCQKGQKAINADHLYICFLIISWINPDRQKVSHIATSLFFILLVGKMTSSTLNATEPPRLGEHLHNKTVKLFNGCD